jgi:hypothetical protein
MSNNEETSDQALATHHNVEVDGFAGYEDGIEGDVSMPASSLMKGMRIKFTNTAAWIDTNDNELPTNLETVVIDIIRAIVKFVDQQLVDYRVLAPHERFPDIKALNDAAPKDEWSEGPNGEMQGPWRKQSIVYLLNLETMDRYSYPTGTVGGSIAIRELVDKTNWTRKLRGSNTYPRIALRDVFMNTRFGGRQRPHFEIRGWVQLGGDEQSVTALPAPKPLPGVKEIAEPTLAEHMRDELPPWNDDLDNLIDVPAKATAATLAPSPTQKPATTRKGVQKIGGRRS